MDKVDEAKDKAMDAKDVFVEKVGEENIQMAKDKVKNVVNQAKDIVSEFVGKDDYEEVYTHDFNEDDFVDEDAVNEDVETEDDVDLGEGDDLKDFFVIKIFKAFIFVFFILVKNSIIIILTIYRNGGYSYGIL